MFYTLLLAIALNSSWLLDFNISGRILDKYSRQPIPEASVQLLNSTSGTISNQSGEFSLSITQNNSIELKISHVGYHSEIVRVFPGDNISVYLINKTIESAEVVVLAQRVNQLSFPGATSELTAETIQHSFYAQDVPAIMSILPNTTFYSENGNAVGYSYLQMRGFDQRRISISINNIPQNDPEDHNVYWFNLPDLLGYAEDIQVQRGTSVFNHQGIGGSINIKTQMKSPTQSTTISYGSGSFQTQKMTVDIQSGILWDQFAVNTRFSKLSSAGYRDHSQTDAFSWFLGGFYYGENSSWRIQAYGGPVKDNLAYYGLTKEDFEKNPSQNYLTYDKEYYNQPHIELINDWSIAKNIQLSNAFYYVMGRGYFDIEYPNYWEYPFSEFGISSSATGLQISDSIDTHYTREYVDNDTYGWVPTAHISLENHTFQLGGELKIHRSHHYKDLMRSANYQVTKNRFNDYGGSKLVLSIYGTWQYLLSEKISTFLSFNTTHINYGINTSYRVYGDDISFTIPYVFISPKIGITYQWNDQLKLFGSVGFSSREPRLKELFDAGENGTVPNFELNPSGSINYSQPNVKPEQVLNVEVGSRVTADSWQAGINIYSMQFKNEIIKAGRLGSYGTPVYGNADQSSHIGIEIESQVNIAPNQSLWGNFSLSNNTFESHSVLKKVSGGGYQTESFDGNQIPGFPSQTGNIGYTIEKESVSFQTVMQYVGSYYADNFNNISVPSYMVTNLSVTLFVNRFFSQIPIKIRAFANNILDKKYAGKVEMDGSTDYYFPGAGRNYYIDISFQF